MSDRAKTLLRLLFTCLLLGVLFYRMDWQLFRKTLASARVSLILLGGCVQIVSLLLAVLRWKVILGNFRMRERLGTLAQITMIGYFFNLFLPSGIGGDFFRAYYLSRRQGRGMSSTFTTTVLERSAGLCALLIIGTVSAAVYYIEVRGVWLFPVFVGLCSLYGLANVILFHPWTHRRTTRLLGRFGLQNVEERMELVYQGLTTLRRSGASIGMALFLSLLIQFFSVTIVWITARAIHIEEPFWTFLIFIPIINLSIMIPLTINGIGLRESVYYLLFSQVGLPMETAVSLSLLSYAVVFVSALPGVLCYTLYKRGDLPASWNVESVKR